MDLGTDAVICSVVGGDGVAVHYPLVLSVWNH